MNDTDMEKSTYTTTLKWKVSIEMEWYNTIEIADYYSGLDSIKMSNGFVSLKKYDYFIHELSIHIYLMLINGVFC